MVKMVETALCVACEYFRANCISQLQSQLNVAFRLPSCADSRLYSSAHQTSLADPFHIRRRPCAAPPPADREALHREYQKSIPPARPSSKQGAQHFACLQEAPETTLISISVLHGAALFIRGTSKTYFFTSSHPPFRPSALPPARPLARPRTPETLPSSPRCTSSTSRYSPRRPYRLPSSARSRGQRGKRLCSCAGRRGSRL